MSDQKPTRYIIQKHVTATSVKEALEKEAATPITSVYPDSNQNSRENLADGIGFKYVENDFPYEY